MNDTREFYIKGSRVYKNESITLKDIRIFRGLYEVVESFEFDIPVYDGKSLILAPSFCDLHTHLREPGFPHKETIRSGSLAAARGGFTTVCAMPNLDPVPDSVEAIAAETEIIKRDAAIEVLPYAAITIGEKGTALSDIEQLSEICCGFSDDGKGVQDRSLMYDAMYRVASAGCFIAAHAENEDMLNPGGVIHDGEASRKFGLMGMSSASEYTQIERDLTLVSETGCRYHICHISALESIRAVRRAKEAGLSVTCEVTPHHLALSERDIIEDSGRYKMNPPLRGEQDRKEIIDAIADGTIDIIATDHAPHSEAEKSNGFLNSAFGTVGSETAFAVCNTFLVKQGIIGYERLFYMMCDKPREILGRDTADGWVLIDTETERTVHPEEFLSKGRSTPFDGMKLSGDVMMTSMNGKIVYSDRRFI